MTELGIRQVDAELVEAAEAFGTPPRDTLLRVQLPLALPTIMAGVNQVIMLGLSMVVIAGMVGAGGLGGAVYEAIGQLDIGLGFEAGLAVVVLAMYLDRMTGALGTQVSPLGRRAAAKARTAGTPKLWNHRPSPVVALVGVRRPRARRRRPRHLRLLRRRPTSADRDGRRPGQEGQHRLHPLGRGHRLHLPVEGAPGAARLRGRDHPARRPARSTPGLATRPDRLPDGLLAARHPRRVLEEVRRPAGGPRQLVRPHLAGADRPLVREGRRLARGPQGTGRRSSRAGSSASSRAPE